MTSHWDIYESPLGPLTLVGRPGTLSGLRFPGTGDALDEADRAPELFTDAAAQLEEYFDGRRTRFDLGLDLAGTPFQQSVWSALRAIPYGSTRSYTEIAEAVARRDRVRAVGAAVGRTPVPIIVPCHRVLGADGSLTGYGGGLNRKRALLDLESGQSRLSEESAPAPRQRMLT
jgi:methylated-DNA-[protein]-cysteine S-methyltransferase